MLIWSLFFSEQQKSKSSVRPVFVVEVKFTTVLQCFMLNNNKKLFVDILNFYKSKNSKYRKKLNILTKTNTQNTAPWSWSLVNEFIFEARSLRFKSWAGQIELQVANALLLRQL